MFYVEIVLLGIDICCSIEIKVRSWDSRGSGVVFSHSLTASMLIMLYDIIVRVNVQ